LRTIYFDKSIAKVLLTKALRPIWPDVVFSPLSPVCCAEVPEPLLPGPRWVRVRNQLSGICGTDLHLLFAEADPRVSIAALPGTDRRYLGHEVVGIVTEAGPGVRTLQVGDRVVMEAEEPNCFDQEIEPPCRHCDEGNYLLCENASSGRGPARVGGGWGEGFVAHETDLFRVPDELDDDAAVMIEPLACGVRTVLRRRPASGEHALVVGCGTVGLATIQAARTLTPGCHLTAVARHPHQADMASVLGADVVLLRQDPYEAAERLAGGKLYTGELGTRTLLGGFDVVYDCVGTARSTTDSLRLARAGGTVVLAGVHLTPMNVDLTPIWYQEVNLIGVYAHGKETWDGRRLSTYELVSRLLRERQLTHDGFITHRFPLARWREAVRTAADKRSGAIKVVLDCRAGV